MIKREVVRSVYQGKRPPYVPWDLGFTLEAREKLLTHYRLSSPEELDLLLDNHSVSLGACDGVITDLGNGFVRDHWGVVWNRTVDKDIGLPEGQVLPEPDLRALRVPDPTADYVFENLPGRLKTFGDRFRVFMIGFSLYERAWTLRGMENLMMDFIENPAFVKALLNTIADYNIAQIKKALANYEFDAVHFGDDWGQQVGLQMGPTLWREFIKPVLERTYGVVRGAGKFVSIHSCGDVDELFPDLVEIGLNCFNPFQPEVMDVSALHRQYLGKLAFHGGLSTQKTLPYGSADDVRTETRALLEMGKAGGYLFAPAHAVESDVPLENMLAFIDLVKEQPGYLRS